MIPPKVIDINSLKISLYEKLIIYLLKKYIDIIKYIYYNVNDNMYFNVIQCKNKMNYLFL